jgi:hypothetical protein
VTEERDARSGQSAPSSEAQLTDGTPDVSIENVTIFSAPAVELVMHWWRESNRRWAARDRLNSPAA